jgi:hypothetical protein
VEDYKEGDVTSHSLAPTASAGMTNTFRFREITSPGPQACCFQSVDDLSDPTVVDTAHYAMLVYGCAPASELK